MADYKTVGSFNLVNQITLKNVNSNVDRDYGPYDDKSLDEIADAESREYGKANQSFLYKKH